MFNSRCPQILAHPHNPHVGTHLSAPFLCHWVLIPSATEEIWAHHSKTQLGNSALPFSTLISSSMQSSSTELKPDINISRGFSHGLKLSAQWWDKGCLKIRCYYQNNGEKLNNNIEQLSKTLSLSECWETEKWMEITTLHTHPCCPIVFIYHCLMINCSCG